MSVYLSILKQWIIDPIQDSIVFPIFNPSIQTLLLLIILPILNHFTANPIKTLILLLIILPILNQWIIDPIQISNVVPILNHSIQTLLLLPIIGFIGKQIKDHLLKFVFNHLLKCFFVPTITHFCYPFKCDSYVDKLNKQTEKLKEKRDSLEQSVVETDEVTKWLSSANNEINEAEALIQHKEEAKMKKCLFGLCPNLKTRYQLSKEADKKTSAIDKLRNQEGLFPFSSRPPLQQIVEPSVYSLEALPSRLLILNKVVDALKDPNLYMIGVYGLGGVGKTTLAKEVQRKAMEDKMFKRVVLVPVSQTPDLRKIQDEIADFVDLKFNAQGVTGRASQLIERLKRSKILIILDDIWTEFELNAVGIPLEDQCKGSKLLLSSRSHDVLSREMGTQKEFSLEVLGEEETWKLFQKTLEDANNPELQDIAIEVSKKCSGLPLLVNIVAAALKNKELSAWRDTLVKLSDLDDDEIHGKVHKVLKSSFENLPSNAKSLFLLCSLFWQSNIPTNHLLTYAMGLGLFKNIVRVERARDRLCQTIAKLKTESLLLDGDMSGHVKLHDVVQDFARSIATKDQRAFFGITGNGLMRLWPEDENCTRIVLHHCDISNLPECLEYPDAELLSLYTEDLNLVIPDMFFKGITKLKVLNLTGMCLMPLPSSLQFLTKLHSFYMHQCLLKDVAIIRNLKQLKFLSFEKSDIVELPRQLGELTQLKSLNLNYCSKLKVIPPNILPKLSLLEELYMDRSFDEWDLNGNASLIELEELRQLTTLEVRASGPKKLPNKLFSNGLERYKIFIGEWHDNRGWTGECRWYGYWWTDEGSRTLKLTLKTSIRSEDGLQKLLTGSEYLLLGEFKGMENDLYDLNKEGFPKLTHLRIEENKAIRHIIDSRMWVSCDAFPILESLELFELSSLEDICHGGLGTVSFRKLRTLRIVGCNKLKKLFSFSNAKTISFPNLTILEVEKCKSLKYIFKTSTVRSSLCSEDANGVSTFPNLKSVIVAWCDSLEYVFPESVASGLLQLEELYVWKCKMEYVVGNTKSGEPCDFKWPKLKNFQRNDNTLKPNQLLPWIAKVCPNLEILDLDAMNWMKIQFSEFPTGSFSKLKEVQVNRLDDVKTWVEVYGFLRLLRSLERFLFKNSKLGEVFLLDKERAVGDESVRLEFLGLHWLECLKYIWKEGSFVPSEYLKTLIVLECQSLIKIAASSISFQNLTTLRVSCCEKLENLVTPSTAKSMEHLTELRVENCEMIAEIVADDGDDAAEHEIIFKQLKSLELIGLSNLNSFCSKINCTFHFPSLEDLLIYQCFGLLTIFSHGDFSTPKLLGVRTNKRTDEQHWEGNLNATIASMFTKQELLNIRGSSFSKAIPLIQLKSMQNIKRINVTDSDEIRVIFDLKAESFAGLLSQLQELHLIDLPMLTQIWNKDPVGILDFRQLGVLKLDKCSSLKHAFTPSVASCFIQLKQIEVKNCQMMETIIKVEKTEERETLANKMILPSLESVTLNCLPKLSSVYSGIGILECPSLKQISITHCANLKDFISSLSRTQNPIYDKGRNQIQEIYQIAITSLEELMIDWDLIKCIFDGNNQHDILAKVKAFGLWGFHGECGVLSLKRFPNMEKLVLSDSLVEEIIIPDLNVSKDKQLVDAIDPQTPFIFQNLKRFEVCEYGRLKILVSSSLCFKNLTHLEVSNCDEMTNLITASTAKSLVLLRTMIISQCKVMQEIVGVESDESEDVIDFNQLECLKLKGLPSLTSFCSGNYAFNFPYLDDVQIIECPNMKTFSQQVLTPKLSKVIKTPWIGWDWHWEWEGSLNNTIQKLFMNGRDEEAKATDGEDEETEAEGKK